MQKREFTPRNSDVLWTLNLIRSLKTDIAYWGVPFNRSIYRVNKTDRTFELVYGPETGPNGNLLHHLTVICADPMIGFTVRRATDIPVQEFGIEANGAGKSAVVDPTAAWQAAMARFQSGINSFAA